MPASNSPTDGSCTIIYREAAHACEKSTSIPLSHKDLKWCEVGREIVCHARPGTDCFHPSPNAYDYRPVSEEEGNYQVSYIDGGRKTMEGAAGPGTVTIRHTGEDDSHIPLNDDDIPHLIERDWTFWSAAGWKEVDVISEGPGGKSPSGDSIDLTARASDDGGGQPGLEQ